MVLQGGFIDVSAYADAKRKVRIERFITNKIYPLVKEGAIGIDFLPDKKAPGTVLLHMVTAKRQPVTHRRHRVSDRSVATSPFGVLVASGRLQLAG